MTAVCRATNWRCFASKVCWTNWWHNVRLGEQTISNTITYIKCEQILDIGLQFLFTLLLLSSVVSVFSCCYVLYESSKVPNKCCVPRCKGNYSNGPEVHAFKFPADEELKKKWIYAIRRDDFVPTQYSKVSTCRRSALHLETSDGVSRLGTESRSRRSQVSSRSRSRRISVSSSSSRDFAFAWVIFYEVLQRIP